MKRFEEIFSHLVADVGTESSKKGDWKLYHGSDRYAGLVAGMNKANWLDISLSKVAGGKTIWEVKRAFNGKSMEWQFHCITQKEFERLKL